MGAIDGQKILDIVNRINKENEPALEEYITKFFTEYIDIKFFDELTFTSQEHMKVENAITHLVRLNTVTSISATLEVLNELGLVNLNES